MADGWYKISSGSIKEGYVKKEYVVTGSEAEELAKEQILFKYAVELVAEEQGMTLSLEDYEKAVEEK